MVTYVPWQHFQMIFLTTQHIEITALLRTFVTNRSGVGSGTLPALNQTLFLKQSESPAYSCTRHIKFRTQIVFSGHRLSTVVNAIYDPVTQRQEYSMIKRQYAHEP